MNREAENLRRAQTGEHHLTKLVEQDQRARAGEAAARVQGMVPMDQQNAKNIKEHKARRCKMQEGTFRFFWNPFLGGIILTDSHLASLSSGHLEDNSHRYFVLHAGCHLERGMKWEDNSCSADRSQICRSRVQW